MVTKGARQGGGINQEFGINIYTLSYVTQVNNKDLVYSTGSYIQYLAIIHNGKESEKEYVCVCVCVCVCVRTEFPLWFSGKEFTCQCR